MFNISDNLIGLAAVVLALGSLPAIVLYIVSRRHKERMELMRRGIYSKPHDQAPAHPGGKALFWGLVLAAVGVAGLIYVIWSGEDEKLFFYLLSLIGGGAMIAYWRFLAPQREQATRYFEAEIAREENVARAALTGNGTEIPETPGEPKS